MTVQFEDYELLPCVHGFPEAIMLDEYTLIASFWTGRCRAVDLSTCDVITSPEISQGHAGICLRSLCADPSGRQRCAVATTAAWGAIWNTATQDVVRVYSENGPVWATAFSPNGEEVALGVGYYPLSNVDVQATVERWAIDEGEPACIVCTAVPGVSVDWLAWEETTDRLIVFSGSRSQTRGHLSELAVSDLRPVRVTEVPLAMVRRCSLLGSRHAVLMNWSTGVELRRLDAPSKPVWRWLQEDDAGDEDAAVRFCVDETRGVLLTTCGAILDIDTGKCVDRLPVPPLCRDVASRPCGGFIAVSGTGIVRVSRQSG